MKLEEFKNRCMAEAAAAGLTDYEVYYEVSSDRSVSAFRHEIKEVTSSTEGGVSFRCKIGGRMGYASTQSFDPENAAELVEKAIENAKALETAEEEFLGEAGSEYAAIPENNARLPGIDELKATVLASQDALYATDPRVIDGCESAASVVELSSGLANSRGLNLSSSNSGFVYFAVSVVSENGELADNYEVKVTDFDSLNIKEVTGKATADAVKKLGASAPETGAVPVVFTPDAMNSLLATFSGIFSADNARKGLSRLKGKEGEKIAADNVSIIDDPFFKDAPIKRAFDAEGSPAVCKALVENGCFKTLLYNLKAAKAAGTATTGNASRASYKDPVGIRPFTLYFAPGEYTKEALIKLAGNGVLIDSLSGLHAGANPISGDFSLLSSGTLIENGELTRPVRSFTVAGNYYTLLKNIRALSDTLKRTNNLSVTGFASPHVLVDGLSIAGK